MPDTDNLETATFGTGCFWCTEAVFQLLHGVTKVESGYSGGHVANPTYEEVCSKTTGHAECLNIKYDNTMITFDELLEVFWKSHDPTTINRQGNDIGPQYRSVVFYHNNEQKETAQKYMAELNNQEIFDKPVVTEIQSFTTFYPAEKHHQNYYNDNSAQPYCSYVIKPKVEKIKKIFRDKLVK